MKVTINGHVTPGAVAAALRDLENEYGLKLRDLTLYVRFANEQGKIVDPALPAGGTELIMTVEKPKVPDPDDLPELSPEMAEEFEKIKEAFLLKGFNEPVVKMAYAYTCMMNDGKCPRAYMTKILQHWSKVGISTATQVREFYRKNQKTTLKEGV